ncbi:hypothetical protein F7018_05460 [Tenacibaculum aiptasiae]|uniref:Uncharacterized protein n=1 Tax=Tenacibaculum aiptasiae TaxID=426481 RepID=A0A7J5AQC8_9FLAO|nr:hypothetical protein F7018_05460 [Tenacibaculum aiptasiae]
MKKLKSFSTLAITKIKKLIIYPRLFRLNNIAKQHMESFNYHFNIVDKTSDEFLKSKHQKLLIEHLANLEKVNKKISLLESL